ncbi:MAG: uracil-DNA glycosylase [Halieaceae bacterium]|nr:uracil-DNA glycosylase [Halieaceae bacterium]
MNLQADWLALLQEEFSAAYMRELALFLRERKRAGAELFPPSPQIFAAFDATPPQAVKAVILGQDPYHGPRQAHGLCFSVNPGIQVPPSLANIFRELEADLGLPPPDHGCLLPWAKRGVLLLNSVLTVERGEAGAHQGRGWERFTDRVIECLAQADEPVVFMLWGAQAQRKGQRIDGARHCILRAPHPSPLSAHRGFLGCGHFSAANRWLESVGRSPIDWSLPPRDRLDLRSG